MDCETQMAKITKDTPAMPLTGYRLMDNAQDPTVVGIALETEQGPFMFVVTKEILETLGEAFAHKAKTMPSRNPA